VVRESTRQHDSTDDGLRLVSVAPNVFELQPSRPLVLARTEPTAHEQPSLPVQQLQIYRLEVSNGNGVTGLARRTADNLKRRLALSVVRITDHAKKDATEIHYREGYAAEAAALATSMQTVPAIVRATDLRSDIQIRLVLGRDLKTELALFEPTPPASNRQDLLASDTALYASAVLER
jgi:hypothetical protein